MLAAFNRPDTEPRQIIAPGRIHPGHFSGLAANQRASCLNAAIGNPGNNISGNPLFEFSGGKIIKKEQRHGTLGQHIIGAHRHQINAQPAMPAGGAGQFQLGADTIGAGDQNRVIKASGPEVKRAAKPAQRDCSPGPARPGGIIADRLNKSIASVDINAGISISQRSVFFVSH